MGALNIFNKVHLMYSSEGHTHHTKEKSRMSPTLGKQDPMMVPLLKAVPVTVI
jgi:hypothetical protein